MRARVRVVVIGYGNPLRGDDVVGWSVAEIVDQRWGDRVTVRMGQQLVPEWAEVLAEADIAFVVDAALCGGQRVRLRRIRPPTALSSLDGHQLGPHQLLGLTSALYGSAPVTYLLPLPVDSLDFGVGLSLRTARAAERAVRLLDRRLTALTFGPHLASPGERP